MMMIIIIIMTLMMIMMMVFSDEPISLKTNPCSQNRLQQESTSMGENNQVAVSVLKGTVSAEL